MKYILEGTWTGYTSAQMRISHREFVTKARADRLQKLHKIIYTDGTALLIRVREAEFREKIKTIDGYSSLILEAEESGKNVFRIGVDDV